MAWRALTFLLVLVSVAPPPRVSNALIAAIHRHDPAEPGKTVQSRARNRIGSTIQVAPTRTIAGLASGLPRLPRSKAHFARPIESPLKLHLSTISPTPHTPFRLRC